MLAKYYPQIDLMEATIEFYPGGQLQLELFAMGKESMGWLKAVK